METTPVAADTSTPSVSVICPMYNEGGGIRDHVRRLVAALNRLPRSWELIVVNDGSTDDCGEKVAELAADEPRIRPYGYPRNRGRGYALRTGFGHARGRIIVTTESDLSWGPDIVETLLEALEAQGCDVVVASPHAPGGRLENVPLYRALLSRVGNRILRFASASQITMLSGMTRCYRREVIDALYLESDGKEIHLEIISQAEALGFRVGEAPAVLRWEKGARKSNFNAPRYIYSHLMFTFSQAPFLLMGTAGLISILAGVFLMAALAYQSIAHGIRAGGRPLLIVALLLIVSGVQFLLFSFSAGQVVQLRRLVLQLRNRVLARDRTRGGA
ncbi:MAG: glycosyltransferase family 2 protein [Candidatus Hydrogenedentes bacterium]|nr:glycosyltransferase family 2 protein [Candidatus Hydrogenedentota bacterium]